MSKKELTIADRLLRDWIEGNEFKAYLKMVNFTFGGHVMSVSYNRSKEGLAQSASLLLPDKSKCRVTKFIPNGGKVRLSISTR
jgi:hypothetical protein